MDRDRVIVFSGGVEEGSVLEAIMQLLYYDSESKTEPIYMYINSNGGNIIHGLALYDVMNHISAPVYTICTGLAASMGAFLLSCGAKGHRAALKHARVLIHQPLIQGDGPSWLPESQLRKQAESLLEDRQTLEKIMAENCDKPIERLHADCERDNWMTADEAKEYGLIDEVI